MSAVRSWITLLLYTAAVLLYRYPRNNFLKVLLFYVRILSQCRHSNGLISKTLTIICVLKIVVPDSSRLECGPSRQFEKGRGSNKKQTDEGNQEYS
jgi:hypothetical protein